LNRRDGVSVEHASAALFVVVAMALQSRPPDCRDRCPVALAAPARLPRPGIDAVEHIPGCTDATAFTSTMAFDSNTRRTQTRSAQRRCPMTPERVEQAGADARPDGVPALSMIPEGW